MPGPNEVVSPEQAARMLNDQPAERRPFYPTDAQSDLMHGTFDRDRYMSERMDSLMRTDPEYAALLKGDPGNPTPPPATAGYPPQPSPPQPGGYPANPNPYNPNEAQPGRLSMKDLAANAVAKLRGLPSAPGGTPAPIDPTRGIQPTAPQYITPNPQAPVRGQDSPDIIALRNSIQVQEQQNQRFVQLAKERGLNVEEYVRELQGITPERMIDMLTRDINARRAVPTPGPTLANVRTTPPAPSGPSGFGRPMKPIWKP